MKKLILFITAILVIVSCEDKHNEDTPQVVEKMPKAAFSISPANPRAGQEVLITNESENYHSFYCDYGNGMDSNIKDNYGRMVAKYPNVGTYTISLSAYSQSNKLKDTQQRSITVRPATEKVKIWSVMILPNSELAGKVLYIEFKNGNTITLELEYQDSTPQFLASEVASIRLSTTTGIPKYGVFPFDYNQLKTYYPNVLNWEYEVGKSSITLYLEWID